jgi:hypothetical protein
MAGAAAAASDVRITTGYLSTRCSGPQIRRNRSRVAIRPLPKFSRVQLAGAASRKFEADGRAYLEKLLAARTSLTPAMRKHVSAPC